MIIEEGQNLFDIKLQTTGNLDNFVQFLIDNDIEDSNENLQTQNVDFSFNLNNNFVSALYLNKNNIVTGDAKANIIIEDGDFNIDYNNDYDIKNT